MEKMKINKVRYNGKLYKDIVATALASIMCDNVNYPIALTEDNMKELQIVTGLNKIDMLNGLRMLANDEAFTVETDEKGQTIIKLKRAYNRKYAKMSYSELYKELEQYYKK